MAAPIWGGNFHVGVAESLWMKSKKSTKNPYERTKAAEAELACSLRAVAAQIGTLVKGFTLGEFVDFPPLNEALQKYSELIKPWAQRKAALMLFRVDRDDRKIWEENTKNLSRGIREIIQRTPVGVQFRELMDYQVALITSLPTEAAQRVHKLVIENTSIAARSSTFVNEILRTGDVTKSRATMIARTETSRAAQVLTQTRAMAIGSQGYIWRTSRDADVRPSHKKMEGKYVSWQDPPILDGLVGHAGCLPNCRCYAEPVIPKELL